MPTGKAEKVLLGLIVILLAIFLSIGSQDAVVLAEEFESQGTAMTHETHELKEMAGTLLPGEWVVPLEVHSSQGYGKHRAVLVETEYQFGWISWEDYLLIRFGEP